MKNNASSIDLLFSRLVKFLPIEERDLNIAWQAGGNKYNQEFLFPLILIVKLQLLSGDSGWDPDDACRKKKGFFSFSFIVVGVKCSICHPHSHFDSAFIKFSNTVRVAKCS